MFSSFCQKFKNINKIFNNINFRTKILYPNVNQAVTKRTVPYSYAVRNTGFVLTALSFNLFGLGSKDDDETPEDKLITAIKRSVLCIQREQFDTAEKMLHLALRMAQDLQSVEGITYVYDVMANLAMEQGQFKKAEKLFASVMQRLMQQGYLEDNPKLLHISAKLAHMAQLQEDFEKAKLGFQWTLQKLEECKKKMPEDIDVQELWALTKNWFGQLHFRMENYKDAKENFEIAYETLLKIKGSKSEEDFITLLNNLSVTCVHLEHYAEAKRYVLDALKLAKDLKDLTQEGILLANLGLIYLREGMVNEARKSCSLAWKIGKQRDNSDATEQAEYCLNEIKSFEGLKK